MCARSIYARSRCRSWSFSFFAASDSIGLILKPLTIWDIQSGTVLCDLGQEIQDLSSVDLRHVRVQSSGSQNILPGKGGRMSCALGVELRSVLLPTKLIVKPS